MCIELDIEEMLAHNRIINSLWVGSKLSALELLTIHSFIDKGHTFQLWTYEALDQDLPMGVVQMDAGDIIPRDQLFQRKVKNPENGIGKGSYALFSDLFRYKLLYEQGGWWTDMDMTCLKALEVKEPYYFRSHPRLPMVGNLMKCPKSSPMMKAAYEMVSAKCNSDTEDWLLSNEILGQQVMEFKLDQYIRSNHSNPDDWLEVEKFIFQKESVPDHWTIIHWMNEEWRNRGMEKNRVLKDCTLAEYMNQYNIAYDPIGFSIHKLKWEAKNRIRQSTCYKFVKKFANREGIGFNL